MKRNWPVRSIGCVAAVLLTSALVAAPTPLGTAFTYQGQLTQSGNPANGLYDLNFRLYDAVSGGAQVGAAFCVDDVNVIDGQFVALLNFGAQFNGDERFLEIQVRADTGLDCTDTTGFTLLGPRQALSAVPYALYALNATSAANAANATQLNGQASAFYQNATNLSTGTLADARLTSNVGLLNAAQIFSGAKTFSAAASFTAAGSPFTVTSTTKVTNLNADLLDGLNSTAFLTGIPLPLTLSGTSASHIIRGENASTGVFAAGVIGAATAGTGNTRGVTGENSSTSGQAVFGNATAGTGATFGGYFQSSSTSGTGVYGQNFATSGLTYGVQALNSSTDGIGVYGTALASSGITSGGWFGSGSTTGRGVVGSVSAVTGENYGVLGAVQSSSGWGVYASGKMGASGTKSFRIDHPDDPENRYLLHYCAEGPEPQNIYNGTVMLGDDGGAVVQLPAYFAKINKEPRYALTAIGAPMPNLHVAEEIGLDAIAAGGLCSFRIAGGAPGKRVSWEVKAVRNDLWVRMHGAPVETEKQGRERGAYQHPELYGQPVEKGMNYNAAAAEGLAMPVSSNSN